MMSIIDFKAKKLNILSLLVLLTLNSCTLGSSNTVILWTDRPEFALYGEYFNTSQNKYKVEVQFNDSPANKLTTSQEYPDIVAANWLKNASVRAQFRPLDNLLKQSSIRRSDFYPQLLSLGNIEGRQYLLPVNYNISAIIFARDSRDPPSDPFIIEMKEIKERSKAFNVVSNGTYSRMGFSLSSNNEFLFVAVTLSGADFKEASGAQVPVPLIWEEQALEQGINWLQRWVLEANISVQVEDDFGFKYYYDPLDKLVNSGRVLYIFMNSSEFFTLPEERRVNLDYRWIAANETIPLDEFSVYYGIHKKTKALKGARAFTRWFFSTETQKLLLEEAKIKKLQDTSFGIAGGFSAMKTVTEQVFPQFYIDLIGRMPPDSYLTPPNILPRNWITVKERVILPYLRERIRYTNSEEIRPLERRVNDWYRLNRN